eukprot:92141_1
MSNNNPMFTIVWINHQGHVKLYLQVISFPKGVYSMKINYALKCPQFNISKTFSMDQRRPMGGMGGMRRPMRGMRRPMDSMGGMHRPTGPSNFNRPMQQFPGQMQIIRAAFYGNPLPMQQQQQLAAQQLAAQQLAAQQRAQLAESRMTNTQQEELLQQQQQIAAQQMSSLQQAAEHSSMQMSSIKQQAAHQRSQSMGQTQQTQPAQSMQSGPQSASINAWSASITRPSGLTASQQMVVSG